MVANDKKEKLSALYIGGEKVCFIVLQQHMSMYCATSTGYLGRKGVMKIGTLGACSMMMMHTRWEFLIFWETHPAGHSSR